MCDAPRSCERTASGGCPGHNLYYCSDSRNTAEYKCGSQAGPDANCTAKKGEDAECCGMAIPPPPPAPIVGAACAFPGNSATLTFFADRATSFNVRVDDGNGVAEPLVTYITGGSYPNNCGAVPHDICRNGWGASNYSASVPIHVDPLRSYSVWGEACNSQGCSSSGSLPGGLRCTPNCSNIAGPASLMIGSSGTYTASHQSTLGQLVGNIRAGRAGALVWNPGQTFFPGTSGNTTYVWTPTTAGTYDVFCNSWLVEDDAVAECRGASYNIGGAIYACTNPATRTSMTVVVTAPTPTVTPTPTLTPTPTPGIASLNVSIFSDANGDGNPSGDLPFSKVGAETLRLFIQPGYWPGSPMISVDPLTTPTISNIYSAVTDFEMLLNFGAVGHQLSGYTLTTTSSVTSTTQLFPSPIDNHFSLPAVLGNTLPTSGTNTLSIGIKQGPYGWFQAKYGDMHANGGGVFSQVPAGKFLMGNETEAIETRGLASATGSINVGGSSYIRSSGSDNWNVPSYASIPNTVLPPTYSQLFQSVKGGTAITDCINSWSLPAGTGIWRCNGGATLTLPASAYSGSKVIFVNGDLTINGSGSLAGGGTNTDGLILIVKGKVTIASNVTQLDAYLLFDGKDSSDNEVATPFSDGVNNLNSLQINGGLVYTGSKGLGGGLTRTIGAANPSEQFVYQPKYAANQTFLDTLGEPILLWAEK